MAGCFLLDENLSPRLASALETHFPGCMHVRDVGLKGKSDHQIWDFAAKNGFAITTKDDDFRSLSLLRGAPPKVIWLVVGNTSTGEILRIFLDQLHAIEAFINESTTALLALRKA